MNAALRVVGNTSYLKTVEILVTVVCDTSYLPRTICRADIIQQYRCLQSEQTPIYYATNYTDVETGYVCVAAIDKAQSPAHDVGLCHRKLRLIGDSDSDWEDLRLLCFANRTGGSAQHGYCDYVFLVV